MENLEVRPAGGLLELSWRPSSRRAASEFVVEWSSGGVWDWQRESRGTTKTTIRGDLLVPVHVDQRWSIPSGPQNLQKAR